MSFRISVLSVFVLVSREVLIPFRAEVNRFTVQNYRIFLILLFRFFQNNFHFTWDKKKYNQTSRGQSLSMGSHYESVIASDSD